MRMFMLFGAVLLSAGLCTKAAVGQAPEPPCPNKDGCCDFSTYKRLKEPHTIFKAALKKVDPVYPPAAKIVRASGKVVVRILVNRKGDVVKACAIDGHQLLRAASVEAAKRWKFKENFGFVHSRLKQHFAEADLTFNFDLP